MERWRNWKGSWFLLTVARRLYLGNNHATSSAARDVQRVAARVQGPHLLVAVNHSLTWALDEEQLPGEAEVETRRSLSQFLGLMMVIEFQSTPTTFSLGEEACRHRDDEYDSLCARRVSAETHNSRLAEKVAIVETLLFAASTLAAW